MQIVWTIAVKFLAAQVAKKLSGCEMHLMRIHSVHTVNLYTDVINAYIIARSMLFENNHNLRYCLYVPDILLVILLPWFI
jgi:hypothetical protein